jgi:aerobic-type carbon monoxide dehydrogenase small subunit (CoxS/CutS family)
MNSQPIKLTVNGVVHALEVEPRRSLVDVLRRSLGCTGTTVGCDSGHCGSCTVLVDGEPARACLILAVQADNCVVETVESLVDDPTGRSLREAFSSQHALQCGYCTPGMMMLCTALLRGERPDRERIRESVSANLCRCTGYNSIVDAVDSAARSGEDQS